MTKFKVHIRKFNVSTDIGYVYIWALTWDDAETIAESMFDNTELEVYCIDAEE